MPTNPFSAPGRFWRGNLHTHSTRSDGHRSPQQVCNFYREAGYDFLALTDHFLERYGYPVVDTRSYRAEDFTTIFGAELHAGWTELGQFWHILAVGLPLDFAPTLPDEDGPQIAARALEAGAFVAAAHPAWYSITEQDILSLGAIDAVEVFNGTSIDHNDKPESWHILDILHMRGKRYFACATDDAHFDPARDDSMKGWVHVKAEALEPELLLEALKAGHYYSSTGPQIHDVDWTAGDRVRIRCSSANRVWITGKAQTAASVFGNGITEAEFNLTSLGDSPYFRVTVRDNHGGRAWSNPFWR